MTTKAQLKAQVFYNKNLEAMWRGARNDDEYELVAEMDITENHEDDDLRICEDIFRMMNVVNGDELPVLLKIRSMSVGDVIGIDNVIYTCEGVGWKRI